MTGPNQHEGLGRSSFKTTGTLYAASYIQAKHPRRAPHVEFSGVRNETPNMKGENHEHQSTGSSFEAPQYTYTVIEGYERLVSEAFHQGVGDRCGFGRTLLYSDGGRLLQFVQGLWRLSVQPVIRLEGPSANRRIRKLNRNVNLTVFIAVRFRLRVRSSSSGERPA